MNTYHIVYATDNNYAFLCAVSISSMLRYKREVDEYVIHILSDGTIEKEEKKLFLKLEKNYKNIKILIHDIYSDDIEKVDLSWNYLNKMTLYRLMAPSILFDIDKCLYLDCDIIVSDGLTDLLDCDIGKNYLAAVKDSDIEKVQYNNKGNLNLKEYFNAGVLVMNLEMLRVDKKEDEFLSIIGMRWDYSDQDILNKVCYGKVKFLDNKYNCFSYDLKQSEKPTIIHYISVEGARPWIYIRANRCDDWWEAASFFEDTVFYNELRSKAEDRHYRSTFKYIVDQCMNCDNVYVFGAGYYGNRVVRCLNVNRVSNLNGVIDNNDGLWGKNVFGISIISPGNVDYNDNNCFIVSVVNENAREEISAQLISFGANEHQIIYYEEKSPEEYFYMSPEYQAEERENILRREIGTGTERLGWDNIL